MPNTIFVIGAADSDAPWVLNLDGYQNEAAARNAIAWQFEPHGRIEYTYWRVADLRDGQFIDRDTGAVYRPDRRPYTQEAWASFTDRIGYQD